MTSAPVRATWPGSRSSGDDLQRRSVGLGREAGRAGKWLCRPDGAGVRRPPRRSRQPDAPRAPVRPDDGRQKSNGTCDRCGPAVHAVYRVNRDGRLYLMPALRPGYGRRCRCKAGPCGR
jgi:hypothetical protein